MRRYVIFSVIMGVALAAASGLFGAAPCGVYCHYAFGATDACWSDDMIDMSGTGYDAESVWVSIVACSDSTDTVQTGYTDEDGWFPISMSDTSLYPYEGTWYVVSCSLGGYIPKIVRTYLYDSLTTEIIALELMPEPECSTYTWSARVLDKRTARPLAGVVATITQLQTTWWCGDTLTPWGAGAGGAWTVTSDSDGLLTTPVLRGSIIQVVISNMGYDETIVMDADKTSGRLFVAPTGGYRR